MYIYSATEFNLSYRSKHARSSWKLNRVGKQRQTIWRNRKISCQLNNAHSKDNYSIGIYLHQLMKNLLFYARTQHFKIHQHNISARNLLLRKQFFVVPSVNRHYILNCNVLQVYHRSTNLRFIRFSLRTLVYTEAKHGMKMRFSSPSFCGVYK